MLSRANIVFESDEDKIPIRIIQTFNLIIVYREREMPSHLNKFAWLKQRNRECTSWADCVRLLTFQLCQLGACLSPAIVSSAYFTFDPSIHEIALWKGGKGIKSPEVEAEAQVKFCWFQRSQRLPKTRASKFLHSAAECIRELHSVKVLTKSLEANWDSRRILTPELTK